MSAFDTSQRSWLTCSSCSSWPPFFRLAPPPELIGYAAFLVFEAASAFLASSGGRRLRSFWATRRGLEPAWIASTPSTTNSISSASTELRRDRRGALGRPSRVAGHTPPRGAAHP